MSTNGHKVFGPGVSPAALSRIFKVPIPGTDYVVCVRELQSGEFENLPTGIYEQIAMLIVDENGTPVFTDPQDPSLKSFSYGVMWHIINEAIRLNGVGPESAEAALKNFEADPSTASVSA